MTGPYVRPHINLHPRSEGSTPPTIRVTTAQRGEDPDTFWTHEIDILIGGESVATVVLFSHVDSAPLVTQIDERPCAEASMAEQTGERA